jgi:hypothetical protein
MSQTEQLHLNDILLTDHVFDGVPLPGAEAVHLEQCPVCRARLVEFTLLSQEMELARRSQPSPAALARYAALFSHVQQRPSRLHSALQWLQARLMVDTRSELALQGVRSAAAASYRLLYDTPAAEIDLLVEGSGATRRLQGEVVSTEDSSAVLPALIQLIASQTQQALESETGDQGRFTLTNIAPGRYTLLVTPASGDAFRIDDLEIS